MSKYGKRWERTETLAAFNLYCKMPFSKVNKDNKEIIALAKKLDRTPSSLSMKMSNLAWYDPDNESSLRRGSALDEQIWDAFFADPETIMCKSEEARAYFNGKKTKKVAVPKPIIEIPKLEEQQRVVRSRVNQNFFRRVVLSSYDKKCCITGLAAVELLNASHIIPWRENRERLNPRNGLCLNALHDRAFDRGLMTILPSGKIVISKYLRKQASECGKSSFVAGYSGKKIRMPTIFMPTKEFLEFHNQNIYKDD